MSQRWISEKIVLWSHKFWTPLVKIKTSTAYNPGLVMKGGGEGATAFISTRIIKIEGSLACQTQLPGLQGRTKWRLNYQCCEQWLNRRLFRQNTDRTTFQTCSLLLQSFKKSFKKMQPTYSLLFSKHAYEGKVSLFWSHLSIKALLRNLAYKAK